MVTDRAWSVSGRKRPSVVAAAARLLLVLMVGSVLAEIPVAAQARRPRALVAGGREWVELLPGGTTRTLLQLPFPAFRFHADTSGRTVFVAGDRPEIALLSGAGLLRCPISARPVLAVPDGTGGALVLAREPGATRLLAVDPMGGERSLDLRPGFGNGLVRLSGGRCAFGLATAQGLGQVVLVDTNRGAVRDTFVLPREVTGLVPRGPRRLLVPGALPEGLLELEIAPGDRLRLARVHAGAGRVIGAEVLGTTGLALLTETPRELLARAAGRAPWLRLPLSGAVWLEPTTTGGVRVRALSQGRSYRLEVGRRATLEDWPGVAAGCDGGGLHALRVLEGSGDLDGDGYATAVELARGTDPLAPLSAPTLLLQAGRLLELRAAGRSGQAFALALAGAADPADPTGLRDDPLRALSLVPGRLLDRPFGLLDAEGRARVTLLPAFRPGVVAGAVVFDPSGWWGAERVPPRVVRPY